MVNALWVKLLVRACKIDYLIQIQMFHFIHLIGGKQQKKNRTKKNNIVNVTTKPQSGKTKTDKMNEWKMEMVKSGKNC